VKLNLFCKEKLWIVVLLTCLFLLAAGHQVWAVVDYPDMPVVNDATCWKCHPTFLSVVDGPYSVTPILGGKHPITKCTGCHTTKIAASPRFRECTYCHFNNYPSGYPKYMSYRHTSDGAYAFNNIVNRRHPMSNIHLSTTTGCEVCHSRILTDEHYRPERTDKNGAAINCNTCHTATYLGNETSTNEQLRIVKTQSYQIQFSNPWYAPAGSTVSRVFIDTVLDSSSYMELYALYSGKWGLVYGRANRTVARWLDLPAPTTALRTKIHSPYATTLPYSYLDVPKVVLTPNNDEYVRIQTAIANNNTGCGACHQNAGHKTQHDTVVAGECQNCHKPNLIDEHLARTNDQGIFYSCQTCHNSQDPLVVSAIAAHNKNCSACHPQADHETVHAGELHNACQTCHKATISQEHLNNSTTAGQNYTCDTCHKSARKEVVRAIKANSLNCAACHSQGHNILFANKVPDDVPLYTSYSWTTPIEASIFATEPSAPAGFETGQVVLSNRRADVTAEQVWNFYDQQLWTGGWTLKSSTYTAGNQFFVAEFEKAGRLVNVRCYNTKNRDGTGGTVGTGYRIEIWYK